VQENSATDALEKKYLAKLQLSLHSIDDSPVSDANLIEAYTICFTYDNGQLRVGTAEGHGAATNSVVLEDAKVGLNKLIQATYDMFKPKRTPLPGKTIVPSLSP